jgi:hypothetical protein
MVTMTIKIDAIDVPITIEVRGCEDAVEGHFAYDTEEENRAAVRAVHELAARNVWGWCDIRVVATLGAFTGHDTLCACSYASEADFRASGYFADMKSEALADLARNIERARQDLADISYVGVPCPDCGSHDASWHGPETLRHYACDRCWERRNRV